MSIFYKKGFDKLGNMLYNRSVKHDETQRDRNLRSVTKGKTPMPRFFVRKEQIENGVVRILGDDAHHIARSLRMAAGEKITVCDMQRMEYQCELVGFEDDKAVLARVLESRQMNTEPPFVAHLYQALPKGDKLDTVIQKAVECGASEIYPFESERCVVRVKPEAEARKTERRQKIAAEAAKQCGRSLLPLVSPTLSFAEMIKRASESDLCLFCYEGEGTEALGRVLRQALMEKSNPSISVIIGSEGGFAPSEVSRAREAGMRPVGLGNRILRTETASGFVLACLCLLTELE